MIGITATRIMMHTNMDWECPDAADIDEEALEEHIKELLAKGADELPPTLKSTI